MLDVYSGGNNIVFVFVCSLYCFAPLKKYSTEIVHCEMKPVLLYTAAVV